MPHAPRFLLAAALAAGLVADGLAQSVPALHGGYAGLSAGVSRYDLRSGTGNFQWDDSDTAIKLYAGAYFHPHLGLELGYQDLGKVSDSVAGAGASASVETDGLYAGIAGKIPLYDANTGFFLSARTGMYWWDATGRVQVGNTTVSVDDSDSDFYVGVGGGYDFNEQFGLGLTYDRYNVGDNDADFTYGAWSLAGEVRF